MGPAKTLFLDEISTGQLPVQPWSLCYLQLSCPQTHHSAHTTCVAVWVSGVQGAEKVLTVQGWTLARHISS